MVILLNRFFDSNEEVNIDKLLKLNPTSTLANLAKGGYIWHTHKKFLEASNLLQPIVEKSSNPNFFGLFILISCLFECKVKFHNQLISDINEDGSKLIYLQTYRTMQV